MKTLCMIFGAGMFLPTFGATIFCGGLGPVQVTAGLVARPNNCNGSLLFEFGTNPLPNGGQLDLDSLSLSFGSNNGIHGDLDEFIFELDFGFPQPARGTTVLQFTACCTQLLGFSLQAQGSNFSIDEAFPGSNLPDLVLNQSGIVNLGCGLDQLCTQPTRVNGPLLVVTTITDNAGDLAGFREIFIAPEPSGWIYITACLLCACALLRFRSRLGAQLPKTRCGENSTVFTCDDHIGIVHP